MPGFFSPAELKMVAPPPRLPRCGACGLYRDRNCHSPKMPMAGEGRKAVLVIGEAPGKNEDRAGKPFVGEAGQRLQEVLRRSANLNLFRDCHVTNALICRPPNNIIKNPLAVDYCRPNVLKAIDEASPRVIILLGGTAIRSVLGAIWREDLTKAVVRKWAGWQIPVRRWNCWVCPTYHPSYLIRGESEARGRGTNAVESLEFARHLAAAALAARARPWGMPPNYAAAVDVMHDPDAAARRLARFRERGGYAAFDYETTTLKPDGPHATIVSCAVCWRGRETIAFPYVGAVKQELSRFLRSPRVRKIAHNAKFEERWTWAVMGHGVRHWHADTMLNAHGADARGGITNLKFQAFVRLGAEDYDSHISPYLRAKGGGGNTPNRIRELDLGALLQYNGMDSLLEYKLWELQRKDVARGSDS